MIRHTVAFSLRHPPGSAAEADFLDAALVLAALPMVRDFERLRQVSGKNRFAFGFAMHFADQADYDAYDSHPVHVGFVRERWAAEVTDFLEADFVTL